MLTKMIRLPLLIGFLLLLIPTVSMANDEYVLLSPLGDMDSVSNDPSAFNTYFSSIYQIGVSLVLALAVAVLIFGGIQYMTTDSFTKKGEARDTITAAVVGILLAVGSYAILALIIGERSMEMDLGIEAFKPGTWAEAPETEPQGCNIIASAAEICVGSSLPGQESRVVDSDQCQGSPTIAGSVCCYYGFSGTTDYQPPGYSGSCSEEDLWSTVPTVSPDPTERRVTCGSEMVKQLSYSTRIDHCENRGENIDGYLSLSELSAATRNQNSACFGLDSDGAEKVVLDFQMSCEDKGGVAEIDNIDGIDAWFCFINEYGQCSEVITEPPSAAFTSAFDQCTNMTADYDRGQGGGTYSGHGGLDFAQAGCLSYGQPVYPIMDGEVVHTGYTNARGHYVVLRHNQADGTTFQTHYLHLRHKPDENPGIRVGQRISAGNTVIGYIGNSGKTNGAACPAHPGTHLHISFAADNSEVGSYNYYDPSRFFSGSVQEMKRIISGCGN